MIYSTSLTNRNKIERITATFTVPKDMVNMLRKISQTITNNEDLINREQLKCDKV